MGQLRPFGTAGGSAGVEDHCGVGLQGTGAVKIGRLLANGLAEAVTAQRQAVTDNNKVSARLRGIERDFCLFPQG
ncbi:hypothetical protein D3C80_715600 [compost metagenome]